MKINKLFWMSLLASSVTFSSQLSADVSGTVYRDLPVNGTSLNTYGSQDGNELGVSGVSVTVTGDNGVTETVSTGPNGNWTTTLGAFGSRVRVEFTAIPSFLYTSPNGASNSAVQFVSDGVTNVNLGLHYPLDYSASADPKLFTTRLPNGDPLLNGTTASLPALDEFSHSMTGWHNNNTIVRGVASETGALWGVAYDRENEVLYTSAALRRHAGFGNCGTANTSTGCIYQVDIGNNATNASPWLDINTLSATGADPRLSNAGILPADFTGASHDENAFSQVGKMSLGDVEISENADALWVVNLNQRALLEVDIATQALRNTYAIPNPDGTCSNNDYAPWAVRNYGGEVFIGVVCTAETSQAVGDLHAFVQRLDSGSFVTVLDFPLGNGSGGYPRGDLRGAGSEADWQPWARSFADFRTNGRSVEESSPILSNIDFDIDGAMLIGFIDRGALQTGFINLSDDPADNSNYYNGYSGGEILRAGFDGNNWTLESNGSDGVTTTAGAGNGQGPGGGEFYFEDRAHYSGHEEVNYGAIALLPGSGLVAATAHNPWKDNAGTQIGSSWNAGVSYYSNTDGTHQNGYIWVNSSTGSNTSTTENTGSFAKAMALGDLEYLLDPAPVEIGNRIWDDVNGNGTQDADEPAIQGVDVTLTCGGLTATATSDANGEWLIQDGDMTGGVNIPRNTSCTISVPLTEPVNGNGITTQVQNTETGNDADPATGSFAITTGRSGQNNHTYDIGYSSVPPSPSGCTTITNTATITGVTETDTNSGNDSSSAAIQANCTTSNPQVDLKLVKTADKTQVLAGDTLTYTLVLRNEGTADGTGIEISDNLPAGVTHASNNPSQGTYNSGTGIWVVGDLAVGATATLEIVVTINP